MTQNSPSLLERSSRLWRLDEPPPPDNSSEGPVALLRSMSMLALQHRVKLILCMAIGIGLAAFYAHSLPRIYTATASLLLEPRRSGLASGQDGQSLDLNRADSELQIIRSERLLTAVFDSLDLEHSPELGPQPPRMLDLAVGDVKQILNGGAGDRNGLETGKTARSSVQGATGDTAAPAADARQAAFQNFARRIDARRVGQSYVIEISYESTDPALAARVANAAVSGYILQAVGFKSEMAQAGTEVLQWRLDALAAQVDAATEAMKNGKLPAIPTPDADARIIGAALPPLGPSAPRPTLITALGGVLGLLAGCSAIALNLALNRRVHGAKELARDTGIACLGVLPDLDSRSGFARRGSFSRSATIVVNQPGNLYAVAVRDLRTSIEIACASIRNERGMVVAVAGWEADNGVSTLCLSLAQFASRSGRHVTLFNAEPSDADRGEKGPDILATPSLADALVADMRPEQVVFGNGRGDGDGIAMLPIHSANALTNLYVDFRDRRAARIVEAARARGDVLLGLPAVSGSTDALALASHADAVVIVASAGQTTIEQVNDTLQQLRRSGANVIGTVINRARV
ncbi:Wzz/FepE/Etk N-terminal domain-containing protein [Rhizobium sp. BK602]|uniref:Wzz/FepE/Etk N-terminal domain-containing protein n=1 Tax=Rhizobium sp. BK602 TaxID=2586986 RepID=UPI00161D7D21|nr:Wzz/FepE/Etk N-terminal domain-containing protein [Rhizobium sp. BK602]MBB3610337.1 capsular polysaccharide biosynthesis protein [Rhizobium sp. BK602]